MHVLVLAQTPSDLVSLILHICTTTPAQTLLKCHKITYKIVTVQSVVACRWGPGSTTDVFLQGGKFIAEMNTFWSLGCMPERSYVKMMSSVRNQLTLISKGGYQSKKIKMHSSMCPALARAGTSESCFREKHNNLIRRLEVNKLKLYVIYKYWKHLKEGF